MKFTGILILFLLLLPTFVFGTTYHVRKDGHNTASGLNDTSDISTGALLTIQHCISSHATSVGDICTIHTGDYTSEGKIVSSTNGSLGSLITVQGHTGDTVSITNIGITHTYNKFDNFTLALPGTSCDGSQAAIIMGAANSTASNNYIYGTPIATENCNTQCPIGVLFDTNSAVTSIVENNTFEGYFTYIFAMHRPGTIQNNTIKNVIDVERIFEVLFVATSVTDGTIIHGNEIYSYTSPGTICSNHPDIIQVVDQGGSSSGANWVITDNYWHDCEASICENGGEARTTGWIIRNNVFANIRDAANFATENTVIQNNTFFQVALTQAGIISVSNNTTEIRNNIMIGANAGTTYGMIDIQGGATPVLGYNYFSLPLANSYGARDATAYNLIKGTGSINGGDPKFVAAYDNCVNNVCDFRLQSDSPLKDVGATLTGFSTDKNGVSRPQGAAWDIGAYEFIGGTATLSSSGGSITLGGSGTITVGAP